jgi:fatty acid desaturase
VPQVAVVLGWVWAAPMPLWAYLLAVWLGIALLKIRTFLEHRAHEKASGRTVIIEDRGPLALLFLNNNLHVVHHMHPEVPWYRLPALYAARRDHYLRRNGGYVYPSYGQIFRDYLWRAKDPVPHPLWPWRRG